MTVNRLHIIGDRQTGKTDIALSYAGTLIRNGHNVVMYTENGPYVDDLVERFERFHFRLGQKIWHSNGAQRVRDESGGTLYFTTPRSDGGRFQGIRVGTVILDEFVPWDDFSVQVRHPDVTHIVREVL